jgi:RNA polymerase sigma-70 factor (ECF subfamily)
MAADSAVTDSSTLLARWRDGDQQAAAELFHRYAARLLALAHQRLSARMAARVDAEDVVQSVYGSFFAGARNGRFVLQHSGDLWRLLVAITLHKVRRQVHHHTAGKRSINLEEWSNDSLMGIPAERWAGQPSPMDASMLADTLENAMRELTPVQRRIIEMRLQGNTVPEIAAETQRSLATVKRLLHQLKEKLGNDLGDISG